MTAILQSEQWVRSGCTYFVERYLEKYATKPLWRYGEISRCGRVIYKQGLLHKPNKKKLNFFQL